jgi:vacuolar-type H+-ATPase subunit F/Vma7
MARVAVLGEQVRVQGFALAGALVLQADDAAQVCSAWAALADDIAVVVLTPRAAKALQDQPAPGGRAPLTVVLPP